MFFCSSVKNFIPPLSRNRKNILFLTLPQRQSNFSSEVKSVYLFTDNQQLIRLSKFSPIFVRKKSRTHIRDSRAVSLAYLCSRIV